MGNAVFNNMPARKERRKDQINLLPQKGFASSTTGRILLWILSTFRVIVIVTEIIVMIAFLSRFWLDAQNTDLNDEMRQKQAVLSSYSQFERDFKSVQNRLKIFSALSSNEGIVNESVRLIVSYLPDEAYLTKSSISDANATIEGLSPNETGIQQFIVNLQSSDKFNEIKISEISTDKDTGLLFYRLTANLKM